MDLNDIIKLVNAAPTVTPERPRGKADEFYDAVVAFLERERCSTTDAVDEGMLRASQLHKTLESLPKLREATSPSAFVDGREAPSAAAQANFDVGHMIHEWWRHEYLGPMGRLWGQWFCLRCTRLTEGLMPETCASCGGNRRVFEFVEVLLVDRRLRLRGHPDGLLVEPDLEPDPKILLEIKSSKSERWDGLRGPEAEHITQAHAYMFMLGVREAMFIYVDKGKQAEWRVVGGRIKPISPPRWKMYHIEFDDALWATIEAGIKEFWSIRDRLVGE